MITLPRIRSLLPTLCCLAGTLDAATFPAEFEPRRMTADEGRQYTATDVEASVGGLVSGLGDIDGDGLADIVIGTDSWEERSAHFLLYGDPDGHPSALDASTIGDEGGVYIHGASDIKPIGDFNGDGLADWLLQPRDADAVIVAGSVTPYPSPFDVDRLAPGGVMRLPDTTPTDSHADGRSRVFAAGDYTGDGLADLIVLDAADYDDEAITLVILPGAAGGLPAVFEHASAPPEHRTSLRFAWTHGYSSEIEWFGWGATVGPAGDLDGDGRDDLLLLSDWRSSPLSGAYIVFGTAAGLPSQIDFQTLDGDNGFSVLQRIPEADIASDDPEASLPALASIALVPDMDGDGIDDLLATTSVYPIQDGQVDVVRGGERSWPAVLTVGALRERAAWNLGGIPWFDPVASAGDLNGDGLNDFLIPRSYGSDLQVIYGRGEPFENIEVEDIDGIRGFVLKATLGSDYLDIYRSAAAGDVDGDGVDDLLIGQPDALGLPDDLDAALDDPDDSGTPRSGFITLLRGRLDTSAPASPWALYPALASDFIELRWLVPDGSSPAGFELVRDGTQIGALAADARGYIDAGALREARHTYELVAVDSEGRRSPPLFLSLTNDSAYYPAIGGAVYSDTVAEILWVDDREEGSWPDIRNYTIYRDGTRISTRRARSWLDETYDPAGHSYFVETAETFYNPALRYALRSADLALPEQDGTRPPAQATDLQAELRALGTAGLSWEAPPWGAPPLSYEVTADGFRIGSTNTNALLDTGLPTDRPYRSYSIVTVDANGRRSPRTTYYADFSDTLQALLPSRATNLAIEATTETSLSLSWSAHPVGMPAATYEITGDGGLITSTAGTRYTDSGLAPDTRYFYTVTAIDSEGYRSASTLLEAITAGGPFAPASARALAYGPDTVELFWARASGGATFVTAYDIYRDGKLITTLDALSLMEYDLKPDTRYRYTVHSVAADGGRSPRSAEVTISTPSN